MLEALIDAELLRREEAEGPRPITAGMRWRASELGMCLRRQYLRAKGVPESREVDARTRRVFSVGHFTAAWVQDFLGDRVVASEVPIWNERLQLGGNADFLVRYDDGLVGVELKSMSSRSFWHAVKEGRSAAQDHQLIQAAGYELLFGEEDSVFGGDGMVEFARPARWVVACVSKDDLSVDETTVTKAWVDEAEARLRALNLHWESGLVPPCDCSGWKSRYCPYPVEGKPWHKDAKPGEVCCGGLE